MSGAILAVVSQSQRSDPGNRTGKAPNEKTDLKIKLLSSIGYATANWSASPTLSLPKHRALDGQLWASPKKIEDTESRMSLSKWKIMGAALALGAVTVVPAHAADKARVRGVVESLDGDTLMVKSREGKDVTIKLTSGWAVNGIVKASVGDIKPGDFVGIASEPTASGVNGALEVLIFPAAMKGTGEGDYGWDLTPTSSMTNATVANAVTSVNGPTLSLTYKGGEKKISIPTGTPVVTFGKATKDDIKPGAGVLINGMTAGDNVVESDRVVVGIDGVIPPM